MAPLLPTQKRVGALGPITVAPKVPWGDVTCTSNSNMGSIAKAMKDALETTGYSVYSELRYYQGKQSKHIVSAPTGAGKSLTFELAPCTFGRLFGEDCNAIVLVIVPLISLMKDQVSNLNSRGIRASYIGDDCSEGQLEGILNLKEKIVFGSHEVILNIIPIP